MSRTTATLKFLEDHALLGQFELEKSTHQNTSKRRIKQIQKQIHRLCSREDVTIWDEPALYTYWRPNDINYLLYEITNPRKLAGFLSIRPFKIENKPHPQVGRFKWNDAKLKAMRPSNIGELSLVCSRADLHVGRLLMTVAKAVARSKGYKALFLETSIQNRRALERFYRKHGAKVVKPTQELISKTSSKQRHNYPYHPRLKYWIDEFPLPEDIPKFSNKRRIRNEMPMFLHKNMSSYMAIIKPKGKAFVTMSDVKKLTKIPAVVNRKEIYCGGRDLPRGKRYGTASECKSQIRKFGLEQLSAMERRRLNLD